MTLRHFALALAASVLFSCRPSPVEPPAPALKVAQAQTPTAQAPVAGEHQGCGAPQGGCGQDCGGGHQGCGQEKFVLAPQGHEGCGAQMPSDPASADRQEKRVEGGVSVTSVGGKLSGATAVKVADLLAKPQEFAGKTVRLEGNVSGMCMHKRAWFALQAEGRTADFVRVIAAPTFLVPEGSIGRKARTEGVVEVTEVPAAAAQHYAQEHQLGAADVRRAVVIRATGAEFM